MAKYRKKPVVIEAFQYNKDLLDMDWDDLPYWAVKAYEDGILFYGCGKGDNDEYLEYLFVKTLEGTYMVSPGDYIIQGIKGELYPCKPDIFMKTYERVEE